MNEPKRRGSTPAIDLRAVWRDMPRQAVVIGVVVGAVIGLTIGGVVLKIVGCNREAAQAREQQELERVWRAEQEKKKAEELDAARRWAAAQNAGS